jgi:hypothetical protein
MRGAGRWSLATAYHGRRNRRGRGSWPQGGSRHIRRDGANRSIGRGYLRRSSTLSAKSLNVLGTTDLDRSLELKEDGLRDEDLTRLGAQIADLSLEQLYLLAGPAASDLEETVYDRVEIYLVFGHSCDLLLAWCRVGREQGRTSRGWGRRERAR